MSNLNSNTNEAQLPEFQRLRRQFVNDSNIIDNVSVTKPEPQWLREKGIYVLMTWERTSLAYFPATFGRQAFNSFVRLGHIVRTDAHKWQYRHQQHLISLSHCNNSKWIRTSSFQSHKHSSTNITQIITHFNPTLIDKVFINPVSRIRSNIHKFKCTP